MPPLARLERTSTRSALVTLRNCSSGGRLGLEGHKQVNARVKGGSKDPNANVGQLRAIKHNRSYAKKGNKDRT
jgi:hypothetical protein